MSDGVLSYKKPAARAAEEPARQSSQSPTTLSAGTLLVPTNTATNRKVLAGRKKLQEFYHLQAELKEKEEKEKQQQETGLGAKDLVNSVTVTTENSLDLLNSPEKLSNYLKSNSIHDILKLRNSIAHNLNSHDSEKKSIIYDNYYELIKLSETLGSLANNKSKGSSGSNISQFGQGINVHNKVVDGKYLEATFQDLISFVDSDVSNFNSKFEDLVEKSIDLPSDDSSSIRTIIGAKDEVDEEIKTSALEREINLLLNADAPISQDEKTSLVTSINALLGDLDEKNGLLSNQLKAVITKLNSLG